MKHQMKMFKFAQKINLFTVGGNLKMKMISRKFNEQMEVTHKEILFELKWWPTTFEPCRRVSKKMFFSVEIEKDICRQKDPVNEIGSFWVLLHTSQVTEAGNSLSRELERT